MTVNVLGVNYTIEFREKSKDPALEHADGYCDFSTKCIVVRSYTEEEKKEPMSMQDLDAYNKKVLRHELNHAFLYESGLHVCSGESVSWATNEEMVDWLAIQGPKIYAVWKEAGAL